MSEPCDRKDLPPWMYGLIGRASLAYFGLLGATMNTKPNHTCWARAVFGGDLFILRLPSFFGASASSGLAPLWEVVKAETGLVQLAPKLDSIVFAAGSEWFPCDAHGVEIPDEPAVDVTPEAKEQTR